MVIQVNIKKIGTKVEGIAKAFARMDAITHRLIIEGRLPIEVP